MDESLKALNRRKFIGLYYALRDIVSLPLMPEEDEEDCVRDFLQLFNFFSSLYLLLIFSSSFLLLLLLQFKFLL